MWLCVYCERVHPDALWSCCGCGAPRTQTKPRRGVVTVDLSGVGGVVNDVAAFTAEIIEELNAVDNRDVEITFEEE